MVSAINSALSGLHAAAKRLEISARNTANQFSTQTRVNGQVLDQPYAPQRAQQVSIGLGGVLVRAQDSNPPTVAIFDPTHVSADANGLVQYPNVDPATEMVNQRLASYDFRANLKTLKVADDMHQKLLDILS